jgi:hypothetical protein
MFALLNGWPMVRRFVRRFAGAAFTAVRRTAAVLFAGVRRVVFLTGMVYLFLI